MTWWIRRGERNPNNLTCSVSNLLYTSSSKQTWAITWKAHTIVVAWAASTLIIFFVKMIKFSIIICSKKKKKIVNRKIENLAQDEEGNIPFFDMECSKLINYSTDEC